MDKWLQLQNEFQQGEAYVSFHGLQTLAIFAMTKDEWEGLTDHFTDAIGFKNAIYVVGYAWVDSEHPWYLYGFTEQPGGSRKQKKKRLNTLFRFRGVAAEAGAQLLTSRPASLPGEVWDAVDAWLTWMWKQSPPDERKWTQESKCFRVVWPQPFRVAAEVVEQIRNELQGQKPNRLPDDNLKSMTRRGKRGRQPRKPDALDKILQRAIDRNEQSVREHRWKEFVIEHANELPQWVKANTVRGRYLRLQAHT